MYRHRWPDVPILDPWGIARPFRWTRKLASSRLWLVGPALIFPTLLVTKVEGTLGQTKDFQLLLLVWPWAVYRTIEDDIKKRRVDRITELMTEQGVSAESNLDKLPEFLAEIQRTREARIRPIRVTRYRTPPFIVVVILPILLTIAQIIFG
jgi:hypothetical protein